MKCYLSFQELSLFDVNLNADCATVFRDDEIYSSNIKPLRYPLYKKVMVMIKVLSC